MKFLLEQDVVKGEDIFKNGHLLMHCVMMWSKARTSSKMAVFWCTVSCRWWFNVWSTRWPIWVHYV